MTQVSVYDKEARELLSRAREVLERAKNVKNSRERTKLAKEIGQLYERIHDFIRQHKVSDTMYWKLYNVLFKLQEAELSLKLYDTNTVEEGIDPIAGAVTLLFGSVIDAFLFLALIGGAIHGVWYYIGWVVFFIILLFMLVVLFD